MIDHFDGWDLVATELWRRGNHPAVIVGGASELLIPRFTVGLVVPHYAACLCDCDFEMFENTKWPNLVAEALATKIETDLHPNLKV